jgi:hypothetical protein
MPLHHKAVFLCVQTKTFTYFMTEKIGLIKNPLTIIAIFAGIAEVSGTIVLPFIAPQNQTLFIYFLIIFPSLLVILFFVTLNFNNRVLYAPSDYKDETNYIKINRYDVAKQKTIEVRVPKDDSKGQQLIQLTDRIDYLNNQVIKLETALVQKGSAETLEENYIETIGLELLVSNFDNANEFVKHMRSLNIDFEIYHSPGEDFSTSNLPEHRAIWLGKKVQLETAQLIIKESKKFYPHLKYIKISEEDLGDHKQIYIGGSTESAVKRFNRLPLKDSDFKQLETFKDLKSFHDFIERFGE